MTYFVSDIHGHYELFIQLLERIGFSDEDRMYVLGDMIDKGDRSVKLMKYIMSAQNIHCIMGNHEYMLLKEYYSLMEESPKNFDEILSTLQNNFCEGDDRIDFSILDWLEGLPYYAEGEDFIAVHAGIPTDDDGRVIDPATALPQQLIFDRRFKDTDFLPKSKKCVIFGHTPTTYVVGKPRIIAYRKKGREGRIIGDFCKIHIDTDVWNSKILGCFCKEKLTATYAKEVIR